VMNTRAEEQYDWGIIGVVTACFLTVIFAIIYPMVNNRLGVNHNHHLAKQIVNQGGVRPDEVERWHYGRVSEIGNTSYWV
jgi:hypothetical protein